MPKKQDIIQAATQLFASQGFEGTTTIQIADQAGVTEPLIFYHFKGKDELYTDILFKTFSEYFKRLEALPSETATAFEKIKNLIALHFEIIKEMPYGMYLVASIRPPKLRDPDSIYAESIQSQRNWLAAYLSDCLRKGIQSGEFNQVPVAATAALLISMINGLLRPLSLQLKSIKGLQAATVAFCHRSLVKNQG